MMPIKLSIQAICCSLLLLVFGCQDYTSPIARPRVPWIFRINLDNMPRMLVLALSNEMWAAYDVQHARLYKTWKGGINFNGPMYDDRHNVQPSTRGVTYAIDTMQQSPWLIKRNGKVTPVDAEYLGYTLNKNEATIHYQIKNGNMPILINETPYFINNYGGSVSLKRVFETINVPAGMQVLLKVFQKQQPLELSNNGSTTHIQEHKEISVDINPRSGSKKVAAADNADTSSATPQPVIEKGRKLVALNDCGACHSLHEKSIGPSFMMIAVKYNTQPQVISSLAEKVIRGGTGVWGRQVMTPHPQLTPNEAATMVSYILSINNASDQKRSTGLAANFFKPSIQLSRIPEFVPGQLPNLSVVVPDIEFVGIDMSVNRERNDFFGFDDQFVMFLSGYLNVEQKGRYQFRLKANAGARFYLNGKKIADVNYTDYDYRQQEVTADLEKGENAIRIEYYEDIYSSDLSLRWKKPGERSFSKIPANVFTYDTYDLQPEAPGLKETFQVSAPGFGRVVDSVHPSFDISTVRPEGFNRRISDLQFLPDSSLAVATWDSTGSIYIIKNVLSNDRKKMTAHLFASGLYEVMGLEYVDGKIYALQKWELTELTDTDGDNVADEYKVALDDWTASANFHEWAFGLIYRDGYFYINTGISLGGTGILTDTGIHYFKTIQTKDRGKTLKIRKSDWTFEPLVHGYKAPNGIGFGVDGEIFSTDNEGHMVPTNKLMHVPQQGYPFFGNDEVLQQFAMQVPAFKPPVLWMPETEIANSPSQPVEFIMGPYRQGQMVFGDIFHGGLQRVFVEKVKGEYQGAIFRFTQGLEAGINRLAWGPDGNLYMAGLGAGGDFGHHGECCALQRLSFNGKSTLDILSVEAKANGMEITFTEPLRAGDGVYAKDYHIQQFWYKTAHDVPEGGVKYDIENLAVKSVNVFDDHKKVFLEIEGMKREHVVYIRIHTPFMSEIGNRLWSGESWYTLNNIPNEKGIPGKLMTRKPGVLLPEEKEAGWEMLSLAQTLTNNEKVFYSMRQYRNFELEFEWKAGPGADAGVFHRVKNHLETELLSSTYPEMQLIDEINNPEATISPEYLSGALYKLTAPRYKLFKPGEFNTSRVTVKDNHVEYWLNGIKVTEYKDSVVQEKGYIAFMVQKGAVAFRNIRIRKR